MTERDKVGFVFFKNGEQYRAQLRFPVPDGVYELVRVESPDSEHPLARADNKPSPAQQFGGDIWAGLV